MVDRRIKYILQDAILWAKEYEKNYLYSDVSKLFNVNGKTIKLLLEKFSNDINVKTKSQLYKEGLKRCSKCKEIKKIKNFSCPNRCWCIKCSNKISRDYHWNNREKELVRRKKYSENNKEKETIRKRKYRNTVQGKLRKTIRNRMRNALKNNKKVGSAVKDLGCSANKLKQHLENKFYNNINTNEIMTWDNYGYYGWHIDHIVPLSLFDLSNREQFLKACHYTNLQPMWAKENMSKGNKY